MTKTIFESDRIVVLEQAAPRGGGVGGEKITVNEVPSGEIGDG